MTDPMLVTEERPFDVSAGHCPFTGEAGSRR
jgi:hypothetical protein